MKAMPTDDDAFGPGRIRADGRKLHPAYLFEVKAPAESRGPWDYYKLLQTTPAEQAFRPDGRGRLPAGLEIPLRCEDEWYTLPRWTGQRSNASAGGYHGPSQRHRRRRRCRRPAHVGRRRASG